MAEEAQQLEERIRSAVASGEFVKAKALWIELGERLRREAASGPIPLARLCEMKDLLAWCRTMAIIERTRCQQRLNQLAISGRYIADHSTARQRLLASF